MIATITKATKGLELTALALLCAVMLFPGCKGNEATTEQAAPAAPTGAATATATNANPCARGDAEGCFTAIQTARTANETATALSLATDGCAKELGGACFLLGAIQQNGEGGPVDMAAALAAFEKACDLDHSGGCTSLAVHLRPEDGLRVRTVADVANDKASLLFGKACRLGDSFGCLIPAIDYVGLDDPEMHSLGIKLLDRACQLGSKDACTQRDSEVEYAKRQHDSGNSAPAGNDETMSAAGISWTVKGTISTSVKITKVSCEEPYHGHMRCDVTMSFPNGWDGRRDGMINATAYDADGVQIDTPPVGPVNAEPGLLKRRVGLNANAKRVVLDLY